MKTTKVRIEALAADPKNARVHTERNLEAIKESLQRFGQQKPVVVRGSTIVAGHGTVAAAKALGWKDVVVTQTTLDPDKAAEYAIADNRTAELAEWDDAKLHDALQQVRLGDALFSESELESLADLAYAAQMQEVSEAEEEIGEAEEEAEEAEAITRGQAAAPSPASGQAASPSPSATMQAAAEVAKTSAGVLPLVLRLSDDDVKAVKAAHDLYMKKDPQASMGVALVKIAKEWTEAQQ